MLLVVVVAILLLYRLVKAEFGVVEKVQQCGGVISERRGDCRQRLNVKADNGAASTNAKLIARAQNKIPYLEPFLGERLVLCVRA
jgi:hypothetical protein